MSNLPTNVQRAIDEGYEFRLGEYISAGFNLVQRNLGLFIAFMLVFFVINVAANIIPIIGPIAFSLVSYALIFGVAIAAHQLTNDQPLEFGDFFKGLQRVGDFIILMLITIGLLMPVIILGGLLAFGPILSNLPELSSPEGIEELSDTMELLVISPMFWVGFLLLMAGATYLTISLIWAPYFIWFYEMRAWNAIQASWKLTSKNWGMTFLFSLVVGLVAAAGLLLFCVGILFTYPAALCAQYAAFADITGLNEGDQNGGPDIIDHFAPLG